MYKLTLITLCLIVWQCTFAQNEQLIIEGSIVISDSESTNPLAGTIKWTGEDFEGFDGTNWKSLTCGCDDEPKPDPDTDAILTCPSVDFEIDNCNLTVNWTHDNPETNTVNYDLRLYHVSKPNGVDPGLSVTYPATSNTISICDPQKLGISSGSGSIDVELLYWYDGDTNAIISAGTCTVNYNFGNDNNNEEGKTFAEIAADANSNFCASEDDAYIAEYLYQHPTVNLWEVQTVNGVKSVVPLSDPEPSNSRLLAPAPSGGDDSQVIENFINANPGSEIVGQGTYKFGSTVDINVPVKIWDIPSTMIGSNIEVAYNVTVPNVHFFRCPIDANNLPTASIGWRFSGSVNNFIVSQSGVRNMYNKIYKRDCAGIYLRAATNVTNFRISGNFFDDLINEETGPSSYSGTMRAIWIATQGGQLAPVGDIFNNSSNSLQADNADAHDAEFVAIQGYTASAGRVRVMANRCVNAGKRLVKMQDPDAFVASNFYHWKDRQGPLGRRKQQHVVDAQMDADRITAVNNRLKIEGEASYDGLFGVLVAPDRNYSDIHYDCNDIELIDTPPRNFYALGFHFQGVNANANNQLINCSAKDNVIRGPGGTNNIFTFGHGYPNDATGLDIDISGNIVTTPVLISDFRGSGRTYVP